VLLAATGWAARRGRRVLALNVDHRLQPASAEWARACAAVASQLGIGFEALAWDGPKPLSGLPAAARAARHRLLAEAARQAGARVILFGHTASDIAEGEMMRADGANIGQLREWSPSPVWPQGRDLFCLRPMLGLARDEVREKLAGGGWDWIDDPANEDQRYGRPRARASLRSAAQSCVPPRPADDPQPDGLIQPRFAADGSAVLERAAADRCGWRRLPALLLCVSGGQTPARGPKVEALAARLAQGDPFAATLSGCRIVAGPREIVIARDAGEARRGRMRPASLPPGETVVWDGRFELTARAAGLSVRPLAGFAARLPKAERARLSAIPSPARAALPAVMVNGAETVTCPILAEASEVRVRTLAAGRWLAACDLIAHEGAAVRHDHGEFIFDVLSWTLDMEKGRSE
jgi:tRNA(Ile)-lysidine synthase